MKSVLLLSCLLLIVSCVAGDVNKAVRPPLRNLKKINTAVVMEKPAIYWKEDFCVGVQDETVTVLKDYSVFLFNA